MINIKINNIHFREKKYILSVIFSDILGIKVSYEICDIDSYEIILPNNKKIIISDIFLLSQSHQKEWEEYKYPKSSFNTNIRMKKNHKLFGMYGNKDFNITNESITINNDIIGSAFIFLSRIEELNLNHDKLNRYQYENSLADRFDIITRPIVNEYIEFLKDALSFFDSSIVFKKYSFDVMLTHDIDLIKRWTTKHLLKHSIINFGKKNYLNGFKEFMDSRKNNKKDPYFNFDKIIELSNSYNITSLFLFMCLEKDEFEFLYSLNEVEEPINSILKSKNHKIGIHPSKITYNNHENSKKEINRLSKKIKRKIEYSRQHFLMFDVRKTWNILNANDIKYNLTLGYPEMIGFRCGICYPFNVFDIKTKSKLDLVEIPLIIMDVTLTNYMKINETKKLNEIIVRVINQVKKHNGVLNLIWHNNSYYDYLGSSNENLLKKIMNEIFNR